MKKHQRETITCGRCSTTTNEWITKESHRLCVNCAQIVLTDNKAGIYELIEWEMEEIEFQQAMERGDFAAYSDPEHEAVIQAEWAKEQAEMAASRAASGPSTRKRPAIRKTA